ncbi:MAG: 2-phospho-L-lactate transferase CofD family protein [Nocardioidaceae bacterium]
MGPDRLAVVANTGDDVELYGVHVAPDPDLITYWLADLIDERGYGIRGDSWQVMAALEAAGRPTWFRLGDRDLAMCLLRTEALRGGARLTEAHAAVVRAAGVRARVLPMCDEPVRTRVRHAGRRWPFQEYMIVGRARGPVEGVKLEGIEAARPTPEVREALARAEAVVLGPSNPIISLGPILAVPGMREAIASARAPVVAVSPFVGGRALKGPTELFCAQAGIEPSAAGVARHLGGLVDGVVADERVPGRRALALDTRMDALPAMRRVAERTLEFAASLRA